MPAGRSHEQPHEARDPKHAAAHAVKLLGPADRALRLTAAGARA